MKTARPILVSYRDRVTALMETGGSFGVVENAIDDSTRLSQVANAALWLFAFVMRDRADQPGDVRTHPDAFA